MFEDTIETFAEDIEMLRNVEKVFECSKVGERWSDSRAMNEA